MRSSIALAFASFAVLACGDDDGGDTQGTTLTASTTEPASTSSEGGESSTAVATSSSEGESSSAVVDESSSGTTGEASDPSYPPPDAGGTCPTDTAPIELPGGSVCAPFCAGADAACPAPASGDATGVCTPFEMPGGSGTPCTGHDDCDGGEACGTMGACVAVAFWGCRLECSGGTMCSDGMICAVDACAYP